MVPAPGRVRDTVKTKKVYANQPPPSSGMRAVEKAIFVSAQFNAGIVPIEDPSFDMRKPLGTLDPEDARKTKRKFRKAWRRQLKKLIDKRRTSTRDGLINSLGVGQKSPTRHHKRARKELVAGVIWRDNVVPALEKFDDPDAGKKA